MVEGFSVNEIADCADALKRRAGAFTKIPPTRPDPPWATVSGFSDFSDFCAALSRTWPMFPANAEPLLKFRIFRSPTPIILMDPIIAIPCDELFSA